MKLNLEIIGICICVVLLLCCLGQAMALPGSEKNAAGVNSLLPEKKAQEKKSDEKQKALQISRGKELFVKATCFACHPRGENSLHGDQPLKGPYFQKRFKTDRSIVDFVRKGSPGAGMPPFSKAKLSDPDLKNVIAYIRSLSQPYAK